MANENQKNCIITAISHSFCLLCDECLKENETIELHNECNSHKRNLKLNTLLEKYKDNGIRQVKKGFYCEFCDILFATKQAINRHVTEVTHINNKGLLLLKKVENGVVAFNTIFIEDKAWHGLIDNTCIICNIDIPDENSHKNNSSHIFNLIQNKPEFNENDEIFRKVDGEFYNCLVCNSIFSKDTLSMHFKNECHIEKYSKCKELYSQVNTSNPKKRSKNDATDNERNIPNTMQDTLLNLKNELNAKESNKITLKNEESMNMNKEFTKTTKNKKETDPIKLYDESKKDNVSLSEKIEENHKNISSKVEGKSIEQEPSQSKLHEPHEAIEIAYKFAKKNGLKYSYGKRNAYFNVCDERISSSLKKMEDHVSNAVHKEKFLKSQQKTVTIPLKEFIKTEILIETGFGTNFVILNKRFCIVFSSFHMITHNENTVRCQLCETNIVLSLELHADTQHHRTLLNKTEVIVSRENEFIRKIRDGIYHCGFCNIFASTRKELQNHLMAISHREIKSQAIRISNYVLLDQVKNDKVKRITMLNNILL
ncbi:unnamed protein product [Parnassius mnemosyne]|uniref:C2H2-type domain-containing protein n=1 Tax=Parnassius mnemosyne TaxID=213953 RepID=A0AAV1LID7_9NEOP